jgi:MFS family permease
VFPLAFGIVRDTFPRERVALGISIVSAVFGVGGAIGLPLGGVLLAHAGLASLFWIGLAAVPAAVGAFVFIPNPAPSQRKHGRLDWTGAGLLSAGLVAVLLAVSQGAAWGWTSPVVLGLLIAGIVLFGLWAAAETRVREPLVDMRVFTRRPVALTNLATLIIGFAMFAAFLLVPEFLETPAKVGYGFGASATIAGLILVPLGAGMLVLSPVAGWLGPRIGFRPLLGGGAIFAAGGFAWMALAHAHEWDFIAAVALLGIGYAFAFSAMGNLIVDAVEPTDVGVATGMNTITRTVGGAFGSAVMAAILAGSTVPGTHLPHASGYTIAFLIVAAVAVLAALITLGLPRRGTKPAPASQEPATPGEASAPAGDTVASAAPGPQPAPEGATQPVTGRHPGSLVYGRVYAVGVSTRTAVLILVDAAGRQVAATHAEADGSYRLAAPEAGTYLLTCLPTPALAEAPSPPRADWVTTSGVPTSHDIA